MEKVNKNMQNQEALKSKAVEWTKPVNTLDDAVKVLSSEKSKGKNVFIKFNGKVLYSLFDDENSCYQKVCGMSKAKSEAKLKEYLNKRKEKKKQLKSVMAEWIERGKKIIYPERMGEWESFVKNFDQGIYDPKEIEATIKIMEQLESGNVAGATKQMEELKLNSKTSFDIVRDEVIKFSKNGVEFISKLDPRVTQESNLISYVAVVKAENRMYKTAEENRAKAAAVEQAQLGE